MQRTELHVRKREPRTTAKSLRRQGRLPGVLYGAGGANVLVDVEAHEFAKQGLGSAGAHLIRFASGDSSLEGDIALVRDLQVHPVSRRLLHVDFLRVDVTKPVEAEIALSFVGKAKGLIEGGIVQPLRRELEVRALPDKLPNVIEVDVTELGIHDAIHVADLALPAGVEALYSENFTIVTVVPPVVEVVEAPEVEEGVEGVEGEAPAEGEEATAAEAESEEKEKKD